MAIKNNKKIITRNSYFNRLRLISEGLPMPISRIKECLYQFFSEEDAHGILEFSKIYILNFFSAIEKEHLKHKTVHALIPLPSPEPIL